MTTTGPAWIDLAPHHDWLRREAERLLCFHERTAHGADVGFAPLGPNGEPTEAPRELYATARMIHSFSIAHLLGRPGAADIALHGLKAIEQHFEDPAHGGWYAQVSPTGEVLDDTKDSYGHAFVLLAASSATQAGLTGGRQLLHRALAVLDAHLWREDEGAVVNAFTRDWRVVEPGYRGQNANMHLTEALMAAFEATRDERLQRRAERIAELLVHNHARTWKWRVPEHFDDSWAVLPDYNEDKPEDQFRPYGALVGHWLEWARLVLQLGALDGSRVPWAQGAARELFDAAVRDGWDAERTGFVYSVDFAGAPINTRRMHWSIAEAIGAAAWLQRVTGDSSYEPWYRAFWAHVARFVIDEHGGSWWHELDEDGNPSFTTWPGKPDLYHAYQATLYARAGARYGLAEAARRGLIA
jgi:sulfoquinovose isomerase